MIKRFFRKPFRWAATFSVILICAFILVLLDAFVIPKSYRQVSPILPPNLDVSDDTDADATESNSTNENEVDSDTEQSKSTALVITDTSYEDENIIIRIETIREYETTVHIADITIKNIKYLKTAMAGNKYGRNVKDTTSEIAEANNAIFAINGDYYGFRDSGYVFRNGESYRENGNGQALILDNDGNLVCMDESKISSEILERAWQIWSFGPALIVTGEVSVEPDSEIFGRSARSNPRTAIGQIEPLHYIAIVSEGRTSDNRGLSLMELAQLLQSRGCETAYNLDGGGSSTMYFNGNIINKPTSGRNIGEREVSDIVYIGYE
jgi:exopolysaccharide biosynthesis protein